MILQQIRRLWGIQLLAYMHFSSLDLSRISFCESLRGDDMTQCIFDIKYTIIRKWRILVSPDRARQGVSGWSVSPWGPPCRIARRPGLSVVQLFLFPSSCHRPYPSSLSTFGWRQQLSRADCALGLGFNLSIQFTNSHIRRIFSFSFGFPVSWLFR